MRRLSLSVRELELEIDKYTSTVEIEAHAMVREANVKAAAAEKALKESQMKVEVLQAEVNALKAMMITSTPSRPSVANPSNSTHRSPNLGLRLFGKPVAANQDQLNSKATNQDRFIPEPEVDPVFFNQFLKWRDDPQLSRTSSFMERVFQEDVNPCLDFPDQEMSLRVQQAVLHNSIYVEEITSTVGRCALLDTTRQCRYRMKLNEENEWNLISLLCRNRITAVCNLLSYLRYIQLGLVKSSAEETYWHVMRLRKQMTLARLGFSE